jgi:hypothetical protein
VPGSIFHLYYVLNSVGCIELLCNDVVIFYVKLKDALKFSDYFALLIPSRFVMLPG